MPTRNPRQLRGEPKALGAVIDALGGARDLPAFDLGKESKRGGLRTYGEDAVEDVWNEVQDALPAIPGSLGITPEQLQEARTNYEAFRTVKPFASKANELAEVLTDTKQYRLHPLNVFFEEISKTLDAKPQHADRFAKLLAHVRGAARRAARTRRGKREGGRG